MVGRNPAKFDANVTHKTCNVRNCVDEMGNAEKEAHPEIVCEWYFKRLPTNNTYKLKILVNL